MSLLTRTLKPLLTRLFVSEPDTEIRWGPLRGYRLPSATARAHLSMVFGAYEKKIQSVLVEQATGLSVAYDIGAHVGLMSLLLANVLGRNGRVYAFEPSVQEAELVRQMITSNRLERRIFIQRCAVCDEDGQVAFHASGSSFTGILDKAPENHRGSVAATVPAVTLDGFVFTQGNPPPDFIKIDVESAEALVLAGASRLLQTKRPRLVIEVHGPDACRATIEKLLMNKYQVRLAVTDASAEISQPDELKDMFVKNRWTHHLLAIPR